MNNYFCNISVCLADKFKGKPEYNPGCACITTLTRCPMVGYRRVNEMLRGIDTTKASGINRLPTKMLKVVLPSIPKIFERMPHELVLPKRLENSIGRLYTQEREH